MSMRESDKFVNEIKSSLMIPESDTFADNEIKLHIDACSQMLISSGVGKEVAYSDNPLVKGIILIYVKTQYGFKNDGSVKELPSSFDLLVRQLVLTTEGD